MKSQRPRYSSGQYYRLSPTWSPVREVNAGPPTALPPPKARGDCSDTQFITKTFDLIYIWLVMQSKKTRWFF